MASRSVMPPMLAHLAGKEKTRREATERLPGGRAHPTPPPQQPLSALMVRNCVKERGRVRGQHR